MLCAMLMLCTCTLKPLSIQSPCYARAEQGAAAAQQASYSAAATLGLSTMSAWLR